MVREVLQYLPPKPGGIFVDATIGLGGHTEAILTEIERSVVIGIDRDAAALSRSSERLAGFGERLKRFHSNFSEIGSVAAEAGLESVDGIIADLGVSSMQLDSQERGFSFRFDAALDMRMNPESGRRTAAELLAELDEREIADIIYEYGEERSARRIARHIVKRRERGSPVHRTEDLASLVAGIKGGARGKRVHPATRTFQALRIAVNDEVLVLEGFLEDCISILAPGGRLLVITFHSIEDRIVKRSMLRASGRCFCPPRLPACVCGMTKRLKILTKKPVTPTETERIENPRARSAKLRASEKLV